MINRMNVFDPQNMPMATRCDTTDLRACRWARIAALGVQER
jgi:hypothetical protein